MTWGCSLSCWSQLHDYQLHLYRCIPLCHSYVFETSLGFRVPVQCHTTSFFLLVNNGKYVLSVFQRTSDFQEQITDVQWAMLGCPKLAPCPFVHCCHFSVSHVSCLGYCSLLLTASTPAFPATSP